ncbi:hypothetical protein IW294_29985 [Streptomyces olivaceus]|uniref:hypothetical protein n=1 Tax=Streptomyces olivaceus TaxID=47716 RepID=UPI0018A7E8D0|nr:hypothetical protein [Streptomyces olivaceus]MBF8174977.1 hypothetical protein [Streptomyces olivaceus]
MNPEEEILKMAQTFISGEDRSMAFVGKMESFVLTYLLDSEMFDFLAEGISLYRPWAGSPYWSESDMQQLLCAFTQEFNGCQDS